MLGFLGVYIARIEEKRDVQYLTQPIWTLPLPGFPYVVLTPHRPLSLRLGSQDTYRRLQLASRLFAAPRFFRQQPFA